MKIRFFLLLFFFYPLICMAHQSCMHPNTQIQYVKLQIEKKAEPYYSAYLQLIQVSDSLLNMPQHALKNLSVPGYYINPEGHRSISSLLSEDAFAAYACALSYRLSGKQEYGEKACYFLNAWGTINKEYSDSDGALVLTYDGTALLIAAELMFDSPVWTEDAKMQFSQWVTLVYQQATDSIRIRKNNWGDWGRFGSLLCASFLNNSQNFNFNVQLIKSDLDQRIAPDGRMVEEIKRGKNGIWYTYFSLAPITASCWAIYNRTGENLFLSKKEGALIKKALDYLLYYAKHPDKWKWALDPRSGKGELWPENLLEAMSGVYKDNKYTKFLKDKRPIIYSFHHYAWTFPTLMPLRIGTY